MADTEERAQAGVDCSEGHPPVPTPYDGNLAHGAEPVENNRHTSNCQKYLITIGVAIGTVVGGRTVGTVGTVGTAVGSEIASAFTAVDFKLSLADVAVGPGRAPGSGGAVRAGMCTTPSFSLQILGPACLVTASNAYSSSMSLMPTSRCSPS
jgi:hypothetical protein